MRSCSCFDTAYRPTSSFSGPACGAPMLWNRLSVKFGPLWHSAQRAFPVKRPSPRNAGSLSAPLSPALATSHADRELTRVSPARPRIVAEGATDRVSLRQPSVEEEHLAELHFRISLEIVGRDRHVRKRAEGQVRLFAQAALGTEQ